MEGVISVSKEVYRKRMVRKPIPIRKLVPNMITSGSILCGVMSLVLAFHGHLVLAAWLTLMAAFFDLMDGKVARSLGGDSAFGVEFDSLADVVSFGVAPGMVFYISYLYAFGGVLGALTTAFFVLCGALRLARFNVVHSSGRFQGLPIPAGGLFLMSFIASGTVLHPLMAMAITIISGGLMISSIPYGNFKHVSKDNINIVRLLFLIGCFVTISAVFKEKITLVCASVYVLSGPLGIDWGKWLALRDEGEIADNQ